MRGAEAPLSHGGAGGWGYPVVRNQPSGIGIESRGNIKIKGFALAFLSSLTGLGSSFFCLPRTYVLGLLSVAPPGLESIFFALYAALKRRSSTVVWAVGRIRGIWSNVKIKVRTNVNGNGQEYPFHMGNVAGNINVKADAAGVRDSHLSQKTRKMGHPPSD